MNGELENVEVTSDAAFDRALKAAVQKGGSDPDAILTALKDELGISGGVLSFSISGLGNGSAGRQGLDVRFESGSSTAAANNAATYWLGVLRGLSGSGAYSAHVSAVKVEGGYILAIVVTVEQPGNHGSSDGGSDNGNSDDDTAGPWVVTVESSTKLVEAIEANRGHLNQTTIYLESGYKSEILDKAALSGAGIQGTTLNCEDVIVVIPADVTVQGGLFLSINSDVTLDSMNLTIEGEIKAFITEILDLKVALAGGITAINFGNITNCKVSGGEIIATESNPAYIGGIAGYNAGGTIGSGTISGCEVTNCIIRADAINAYAGGIAGINDMAGSIQGCKASGGSVTATGDQNAYAGGIAGRSSNADITNCRVESGGEITANATTNYYAYAGGIIGDSTDADIANCHVAGGSKITANATANAATYAGGIAGYRKRGQITDCTVTDGSVIKAGAIDANNKYVGAIVGSDPKYNDGGCNYDETVTVIPDPNP